MRLMMCVIAGVTLGFSGQAFAQAECGVESLTSGTRTTLPELVAPALYL